MSGPRRSAYQFYKLFWQGIDQVYPPFCAGCGAKGARWCSHCQQSVRLVMPPVCECCGREQDTPGLCSWCQYSKPHFASIRSWGYFQGPLREAIHALKYRRDLGLGEVLSGPLNQMLAESTWPLDLIVPVPLGVARLKERGYNQSGLIARPLAWETGLRYSPRALARVRETRSQVGLSLDQRKENVRGAFQASSNLVAGKTVLLVDDVMTTGSTLEACAVALLQAGAMKVYGLTLARVS
jgi:competence protein ComFC